MANLDVFQLVDKSVFQGQQCLNVYYFQQNSLATTNGAQDLAEAYIADYLPIIKTLQEADVVHTEIKVTDLFDPSNAHTEAISVPGTAAYGTDVLPVFNAVGFRLTGDNAAVRNGAKRFAGIDEGVQQNGVITNGTFITQLDAVASKLAEALAVGVIDTFFPVLVSRVLGGGVFGLPTTLAAAVLSGVVSADWSALLTSQTSRKIGNGA